MRLSAEARRQVDALRAYYRAKKRLEAVRNLSAALRAVGDPIVGGKGRPAPRPYPDLARPGEARVLSGRYWIAYSTTQPPMILAVFFDEADIPGRR